MKSLSAGLILTNGEYFLGCHSTDNDFYDIPKGTVEDGETPLDACIREVYEETNLSVKKEDIIELGVFPYNHYKDLHLFLCIKEEFPKLEELKCNSTFYHPIDKMNKPEADGFMYLPFNDDMKPFLTKNMYNVLSGISKKIKLKEKQPF